MNAATQIHCFYAIITVLLISTFVPTTTADETPDSSPPSPGGCADSVISMSPCLPYISAPPNDLSDEPASQCCDIFNVAFDSGEAECLCYLVRQSTLLGFPLNSTRLLSLSDLCIESNSTHANASLDSICSVSPTLPPLVSPTKKSPGSGSGSIPRHSPPPPQRPLRRPPPAAITNPNPRPRPRPVNDGFGQNATKPSTSQQSNNQNDVELVILIYIYVVFPSLFYHYIAALETTLFF